MNPTDNKPKRRNLSGIYIFDTLDGDERRQPTCIEDCRESTRLKWLASLSPEALDNTLQHLFDCIKKVLDLGDFSDEFPKECVLEMISETASGDVRGCNNLCICLRNFADYWDIRAKEENDEEEN